MELLRAGLVGYGKQGRLWRMIVKGNGPQVLATVVAIADLHPEAHLRAQAELQVPAKHCYSDSAALLMNEKVDILIVATPPRDREVVLTALDRQMPVFCENPLASSLVPAQKICQHPQSNLCCVNDQWPFLPQVIKMKQMVKDNRIGLIRCVRIGGKGRNANTEIERIGTHLFSVANLFCGKTLRCVAAKFRGGADIIATFDTTSRIPLVGEFFQEEYNVGRCYIQLDGTAGRLRATGGLLEHLSYSPVPYESVADEQLEPGKAWEILHYTQYAWPIRKGMEDRALTTPAMNPTWELWEQFVKFVRIEGDNPFPPQKAIPAVEAMHLIRLSLDHHKPVFMER